MSIRRRLVVGSLLTVTALVVVAAPAAADPAGPTDYDTEITAIEPVVDGVELRMIGGDSFLELDNSGGREIEVVGYDGEPYLLFEPDGRVLENQRSPSKFLNDDRFAETEIPPEADADADPDWREVAGDGTYAWHDHRTHWMNQARPPGREPGDQILEAVVPLLVDDTTVAVTVRSFWLPAPSPLPAVGAALLGASVAAVVAFAARRRSERWWWSASLAAVAALLAAAVGLVAYRSVPAETEPSLGLWLLPVVALASAGVAVLVRRRSAVLGDGLLLLAALELVAWAWTRRDAVSAAIIPTDAPFALDRASITFAAAVGVVVAAGRVLALLRPTAA